MQFTYDFTYEQAEQWVINRLSQLPPLPNGAQPQISPTSPIGEIYRYRVVGPPGYSVTDLKTHRRTGCSSAASRRCRASSTSPAGAARPRPTTSPSISNRLMDYGLSLPQVLQALNNSNINVGGQTVNIGPQAAVVRGVGLIHSMDDIRNTMLTANNGTPVLVSDVADRHGGQPAAARHRRAGR